MRREAGPRAVRKLARCGAYSRQRRRAVPRVCGGDLAMPPPVRRVVTGHNAEGKSVIAIDEVISGERFTVVWTTDKSPADNLDPEDGGARKVGLVQPGGSVLRIGELPPGA